MQLWCIYYGLTIRSFLTLLIVLLRIRSIDDLGWFCGIHRRFLTSKEPQYWGPLVAYQGNFCSWCVFSPREQRRFCFRWKGERNRKYHPTTWHDAVIPAGQWFVFHCSFLCSRFSNHRWRFLHRTFFLTERWFIITARRNKLKNSIERCQFL